MSDIDSGVASPEIAPDDQILMDKNINITEDDKSDSNDKVETIENQTITPFQPTKSKSKKQEVEDQDDDQSDIDETLAERLIGLTEMFPDSLRSFTSIATNGTISLIKGGYQLSRQIVWVGVSTSIILFAPVVFELERFNVEEMVKQDRNRLVLGPATAMSGSPGGSLAAG